MNDYYVIYIVDSGINLIDTIDNFKIILDKNNKLYFNKPSLIKYDSKYI